MRRLHPRTGSAALALLLALAMSGSVSAESASIGATVRVLPLEVSLELSALEARVGDAVRARVTVTNVGPSRVSNVTVELRADASGLGLRGETFATLPRLQPGNRTSITWNVCALRAGNYLVLARASLAGASIESEARLLRVDGQRKRGCS